MTRRAEAPRLVLASASPRRRELLERAAIPFVAAPVEVEEDLGRARGLPAAEDIALRLAARKALAGAAREAGPAVVLGADTIVIAPDGELLGKALGPAHARATLERLSGRAHHVVTAVALVRAATGEVRSRAVASEVTFRALSTAELEAYLATELWRGKAGAYGVQDAPTPVERVRGSVSNVVGLPVEAVLEMLAAEGVLREARPESPEPGA